MSTDLLPCPFCGGKPVLYKHKDQLGKVYGYWVDCECGASVDNDVKKEKAIAAWNRRTAPGSWLGDAFRRGLK